MSGPAISLQGVTFGYVPDHDVLQGLDFDFALGERAGLIGPNGSGKTTLFHLIMGLLRPAQGRLEILGRRITSGSDFRWVRERIGLLFQDPDDQLFCPTVAEDVAFGPLNLGKSREEARRIVAETLGVLGLSGFENRVTYNLSGGEKRLISLATVLAMRPQILLLDEPAAGLDEETTKRIARLLADSDLSYIIISHDRSFLAQTVRGLYRMNGGKVHRLD